ncbi:uncharacterized protein A1O9_00870 [Exophiala aquamarina CBS 119918]|uniref:Major facilitator superfamily (MFS) profile domain-containing protein n=1 Tax=Exophiala aquamarina CBS 119918 TaxID=1182545 RepID=A0A072PSP7_9EURO|nr:uncharacterized protein A1O9_00870 [Exophiala aquamarina CBS 119918]KEF62896.1 hypothetical protein A1O9_00870 [Exophiala aquamarina CBS 119918]
MEKSNQLVSTDTKSEMASDTPPDHREIAVPVLDAAQIYENEEVEPEFHVRTWVALVAMWLLSYVTTIALFGPSTVVTNIAQNLDGTGEQTWIPNSLSVAAALLGPLFSSASDVFQARKQILLVTCTIAFIGSGIAPGAQTMGRLIAAQVVIGVGYASLPLGYAIPSEILPRRWRPIAQALMNTAAGSATISGPLMIGALVRNNPVDGWRYYYWFEMGLWGLCVLALFFGYQPPKRNTAMDHLSFWQKLQKLDWIGFALLTAGLSLFLAAMNLGGNQYAWTNARVLVTLILGLVIMVGFALYEWKGTTTGMIHHDIFSLGRRYTRTFTFLCLIFATEAAQLFGFIIFYPILTQALYETDPFLINARTEPFWIAATLSSPVWAWASTRFRNIRDPLLAGLVIYVAGNIGFTTLQPGQSLNALIFAGIGGIGFGAPLVAIISGIQLSTPHSLIATATALAVCSRSIFAAVFTAIFSAVLTNRLPGELASKVPPAIIAAGLPPTSVEAFIAALTSGDTEALQQVAGVTAEIIGAGVLALQQSYANAIRVIFIIVSAFGALAVVFAAFIDDLKSGMNYRVEAPMEVLQAKDHHHADDTVMVRDN